MIWDSIITILLKRFCTFEEAVDFLLSAIPGTILDDMLGELSTWDNKPLEMRRTRAERQQERARQRAEADDEIRFASMVAEMKECRAAGWSPTKLRSNSVSASPPCGI